MLYLKVRDDMKMTQQEQIKVLRKAYKCLYKRGLSIAIYQKLVNLSIGVYLEDLCLEAKVSQRKLGLLLGSTSGAYINQIVNGTRSMGMPKKQALAELLRLNKTEKTALYEEG